LDEKAIEAVKRWRFKPGTKNGQPTAMQTQVNVDFRLL
jgi:TonB family protein